MAPCMHVAYRTCDAPYLNDRWQSQVPPDLFPHTQEKFRLDLNDQGAVEWMQQLINESATALMPQIVETTHRWAQYWR